MSCSIVTESYKSENGGQNSQLGLSQYKVTPFQIIGIVVTRVFLFLQELFIQTLSKEAHAFTLQGKKKTIQKKDVESAVTNSDCLAFLEGALDF